MKTPTVTREEAQRLRQSIVGQEQQAVFVRFSLDCFAGLAMTVGGHSITMLRSQ